MRFDGKEAIVMPASAVTAMGSTYTVQLWVYPERRSYSILAERYLDDPDSDPYYSFRLWLTPDGRVGWGSTHGAAGSMMAATTTDPLPLKQWSYIAVTNDGAAQRIYLNGVQAMRFASPGAPGPTSQPIHLGATVRPEGGKYPGFGFNGFSGLMRQFGIWNRAMSAAEVKAAMATRAEGSEAGLAGYWPLDDGPGYSFRDLGVGGNTATLLYPTPVKYVNGDKSRPIVEQFWPVWFRPALWGDNPFGWSEQPQGPLEGNFSHLYVIDFDSDGDPDLVGCGFWNPNIAPTTLKAYRNDGSGHFTEATTEVFGSSPIVVLGPQQGIVTDLNHDGRPDLVLGDAGSDYVGRNIGQGQNRVFIQGADGRLQDETDSRMPIRARFAHDNDGADIDGDGNVDLFFCDINLVRDPPYIYPSLMMNDGSGHFSIDNSRLPESLANRRFWASRFLDANGDGFVDLFLGAGGTAPPAAATDVLLLNDGTGHFQVSPDAVPPRQGGPFCSSRRAAVADLNQDGWPDIVVSIECSAHAGFQVLINRGDGSYADGTLDWLPERFVQRGPLSATHVVDSGEMFLQDFNSDGYPELLLSRGDAFWRYYLNNGRKLADTSDFLPALGFSAFAVADFDGDGRKDIVAGTPDGTGNAVLKVGFNRRDSAATAPVDPEDFPKPAIGPLSVRNDASMTADTIAPGTRVRILGQHLGPAEKVAAEELPGKELPTSLAEVAVTFDSTPARLISVSESEIVAMAPLAITGQWISTVRVTHQERVSDPVNVFVAESEPMAYAGVNADGQLVLETWKVDGETRTRVTTADQLKWGDRIAFRLTGAGQGLAALSDETSTQTQPYEPARGIPVLLGMPYNASSVALQPVSLTYAPDGLSGMVEVIVDLPAAPPPDLWVIFSVPDTRFIMWTRQILLPIGVSPAPAGGQGSLPTAGQAP